MVRLVGEMTTFQAPCARRASVQRCPRRRTSRGRELSSIAITARLAARHDAARPYSFRIIERWAGTLLSFALPDVARQGCSTRFWTHDDTLRQVPDEIEPENPFPQFCTTNRERRRPLLFARGHRDDLNKAEREFGELTEIRRIFHECNRSGVLSWTRPMKCRELFSCFLEDSRSGRSRKRPERQFKRRMLVRARCDCIPRGTRNDSPNSAQSATSAVQVVGVVPMTAPRRSRSSGCFATIRMTSALATSR